MSREREQHSRITTYYDVAQPYYDRLWYRNALGLHYGFWTEDVTKRTDAIIKENEVLADIAHIQQGDLVLDAGCGVGGSGIWLAQQRGAQIVGLNLASNQLTIGRKLVSDRGLTQQTDFVKGDYQQLPFKDGSFDVFWSLESMEHTTNLEHFINEGFRVLKPEGRLVIAATHKGREELSDEEQRQINLGMSVAGAFNDFRTARAVEEIIRNAGFKNVKNYDMTGLVMKSSRRMHAMCLLGLPGAKILASTGVISPLLVANNQWGVYQKGLFKSGATSYNVLSAEKPS